MDLDKYDEEEDVPIFTPELEQFKQKDQGQNGDTNMDDEDDDIEEGSSESVSSFNDEDEKNGNKKKKEEEDNYPSELEDSEEEKEDYTIRKTDSIIVTATAESDHSNLEIYIYDHKNSDLYVHHEIILSSYPLCLEWLPVLQG